MVWHVFDVQLKWHIIYSDCLCLWLWAYFPSGTVHNVASRFEPSDISCPNFVSTILSIQTPHILASGRRYCLKKATILYISHCMNPSSTASAKFWYICLRLGSWWMISVWASNRQYCNHCHWGHGHWLGDRAMSWFGEQCHRGHHHRPAVSLWSSSSLS